MGLCCGCCPNKIEGTPTSRKKGGQSRNLLKASRQKVTISGLAANTGVLTHPFTKKEVQNMINSPNFNKNCLRLVRPPYTDFTEITPLLYLTGFWGMIKENIEKYNIKSIISLTYELPKLKFKGIDCIRLPLEDSYFENIYLYFDDISDAIERNSKNNIKTVIHCVAGARRSFTLTIAYLMKYKNMRLKTAFADVYKKRRTCSALNMHFFKQLAEYEVKLFGKNSFRMIETLGQSGPTPDFIVNEFPELLSDEASKEDTDTIDQTTISIITLRTTNK